MKKIKPIKSSELKWIGVDLDDTIAMGTGFPNFSLGKPTIGAKHALDLISARGLKIVIYTARGWSEYSVIESWLDENKIPYKLIVCGKMLLKYMIDDRNIEFSGNWNEILHKVL
jgi:hypothetical protein